MNKLNFLLLLPLIFICGCSSDDLTNNTDSTEKKEVTTTESESDSATVVALSKENFNTYLNITQTGVPRKYRTDYTISFKGVLSFAVYENVNVVLNMHIYGKDGGYVYNDMDNDFERELQLNAAGEGTSTLYYSDGSIDHIVDTGLGFDMLAHYDCTWSIKSISGNVRY